MDTNGNKTFIHAKDDIVLPDVSLSGQFYNNTFKAIWFGIEHNTIITYRINKVTSFLKVLRNKILELSAGTYYTNDSILIRSGVSLIGEEYLNNTYYKNSTVIKAVGDKKTNYWVFDTDIKDRDTGERRPYNYFYNKTSANDIEGSGGAAVKDITIKNIHISVDINSQTQDKCVYGGMRLLHCQGITLDNISIYAVKTGMYITSTWNTSIGRLDISSHHFGVILGTECTNLKFEILSIVRRKLDSTWTYSKDDALQESVLYNEYLKDADLMSGGLIAYRSAGNIQSLSIEGWDYAANFIGANMSISFIYYEGITKYFMYFRTSIIDIRSQYGAQWVDDKRRLEYDALYFATANSSYVNLSGEFCGNVHKTITEIDYKLILSNFIPHKNGVFYPITYSKSISGNIKYDIPSNYIYVSSSANNENLGFSKKAPITFWEALERIKEDVNYRGKGIYLLDDVEPSGKNILLYNYDIIIYANNHKILSSLPFVSSNVYFRNLVGVEDKIISAVCSSRLLFLYCNISDRTLSFEGSGNSIVLYDSLSHSEIKKLFTNASFNSDKGSTQLLHNGKIMNPNILSSISEYNNEDYCFFYGNIVTEYKTGNKYEFNGNAFYPYLSRPSARKSGNSNQRPTDILFGFIYKNTETNKWEIFNGSSWENLDGTQITDVTQ